jgi:hypothetical protein
MVKPPDLSIFSKAGILETLSTITTPFLEELDFLVLLAFFAIYLRECKKKTIHA